MIQIFDKFGRLKSAGIPGLGTVTSVSSGNLSPLFTSSVTSSTSTPNITFAPINQPQKLFYASPNASTGTPSFRAIQTSDLPSLSSTYVPVTRNITINGITFDLSADRTWTIATTWGSITGTLTDQTDLTLYLSTNYFPIPTGTISEYIDGTGALQTFPTIPTKTSDLVNDGENGTSPYVTLDQLPSNLNLFATNVSSDIGGYFKLVTSIDDPDYNTTPVDISTGAITTTGQFIAALATEVGVLIGNPGIINLTTVGNVRRISGTGNAEFYYEVYHRNSGGTETLIATSNATPPVTVSVYTEFIALALLNNGTFLPTDRIVVKYYGNRISGGSNPSYQFQFGGTSPVRTTFPVPASNLPFSLDTLSDVNISGVTAGQVLSYDGSEWENRTIISGTTGYIPKFNIDSTIDNSIIFQSGSTIGIGTISPTSKLDIVANNNQTGINLTGYSLTGSNNQSALDITGTWDTTGTPTAIRLNVTDTNSSGNSLLMDLQQNGTSRFRVRRDGLTTINNNLICNNINLGTNNVVISQIGIATTVSQNIFSAIPVVTGISGIYNIFNAQSGLNVTSGDRTYTSFNSNPTINQTGGANGITRGLLINPSLTSAFDWRSIEWSNNTGWGLYGVGTANNYLNGKLLLGTTIDNGFKLDVNGTTGNTTVTGSISSSTLVGIDNRVVVSDPSGTLQPTSQTIIDAYIDPNGPQAGQLNTTSNWSIYGEYIGTPISDTFQGQRHYNIDYFFECVNDNEWIRLIRG
jgi:hypothetical protein